MSIPLAPAGQYKTVNNEIVITLSGAQSIPRGTVVTVDNAGQGSTLFVRNGAPVTISGFSVYQHMIGPSYRPVTRRRKTRRNMRKAKSSRRNRKH